MFHSVLVNQRLFDFISNFFYIIYMYIYHYIYLWCFFVDIACIIIIPFYYDFKAFLGVSNFQFTFLFLPKQIIAWDLELSILPVETVTGLFICCVAGSGDIHSVRYHQWSCATVHQHYPPHHLWDPCAAQIRLHKYVQPVSVSCVCIPTVVVDTVLSVHTSVYILEGVCTLEVEYYASLSLILPRQRFFLVQVYNCCTRLMLLYSLSIKQKHLFLVSMFALFLAPTLL